MKRCSKCGQEKEQTEFQKAASSRDGLQWWCKPCMRAAQVARRSDKADEYQAQWKSYNRRVAAKKYGLTEEEYSAIVEAPCALCGSREDTVLDHCHQTGKVRGSLCRTCNAGLGLFKDDDSLLERASSYVREHRERLARL